MTDRDPHAIKADLLLFAREQGLDYARVAPVPLAPHHYATYRRWLAAGEHGAMGYLARRAADRASADRVLPGAQALLMVAVSYHRPDTRPLGPGEPQIARYAATRDYHKTLRPRLVRLARYHTAEHGARDRVLVDAGPLLERAYAARAGLGYLAKNTCLITQPYGSWVVLGALLTTCPLPPDDDRTTLRCGRCRRCLDICPTQAIHDDLTLDARRCISYLTIENPGPIPVELRPAIGNWLFGCDLCQEVCPHNGRAQPARLDDLRRVRFADRTIPLPELLAIADDDAFVARFAGTPLLRAQRRGILRNACVVAGNSGDASLLPHLEALLARETDDLLREHATWAITRLRGM
jgi:epoxyqueuosine reductase